MHIVPKRKISLATAKGRAKVMTEFAAAIHRTIYKYLLADFIEKVKPELGERFQNPEMGQRPVTGKGGGYAYVVSTDLKNFDLAVEVVDSPGEEGNVTVRTSIQVRNPFSPKDEVIVECDSEKSVPQDEFNKLGSKLVNHCVSETIQNFKSQVKQEQQQLRSSLESLQGQAKFVGSLIDSFSDSQEQQEGNPA